MFAHYFGVSATKAGFGLVYLAASLFVFYIGVRAWELIDGRWETRNSLLSKSWEQTVFITGRVFGAGLIVFPIQGAALRSIFSGENWHLWLQKAGFSLVLAVVVVLLVVCLFRLYDWAVKWFDIETAFGGERERFAEHDVNLNIVVWNTAMWLACCFGGGEIGSHLIRAALPGF